MGVENGAKLGEVFLDGLDRRRREETTDEHFRGLLVLLVRDRTLGIDLDRDAGKRRRKSKREQTRRQKASWKETREKDRHQHPPFQSKRFLLSVSLSLFALHAFSAQISTFLCAVLDRTYLLSIDGMTLINDFVNRRGVGERQEAKASRLADRVTHDCAMLDGAELSHVVTESIYRVGKKAADKKYIQSRAKGRKEVRDEV